MSIIHLSTGGPIYRLDAPKRSIYFEWLPWCGPMHLSKDLEPARRFFSTYAINEIQKWIDQGKRFNPHQTIIRKGKAIHICIYRP